MFENVAIRILVGVIIIVTCFMVLKYMSSTDKKVTRVEYTAPASRAKEIRSRMNLPKGILKKSGALNHRVSFAPSAVDATFSEYGAWDTNRNSSSGIMNQLNNIDVPTSGQLTPIAPHPVSNSVNQLPSVDILDGFTYDDDTFGSEL